MLAHAFFPENGRLHFDDDEKFTEEGSIWGAKSLIHVAAHEIGHILGLRHSDVKGSVMWPTAVGAHRSYTMMTLKASGLYTVCSSNT